MVQTHKGIKQHVFCYRDCNHHATCNDQSHILWAWAKNAKPTVLPENVAFKLAPEEYVVMQIHYKNPFKEPDHSGVTAKISSIQPKYFAGIYLLWRFSLNIPAGKVITEKSRGEVSLMGLDTIVSKPIKKIKAFFKSFRYF